MARYVDDVEPLDARRWTYNVTDYAFHIGLAFNMTMTCVDAAAATTSTLPCRPDIHRLVDYACTTSPAALGNAPLVRHGAIRLPTRTLSPSSQA